jgi:hypothetical protein
MAGLDDVAPMRGFVERHGLGFFPHAVDPDGRLWARLGVLGQPAWIFVRADGTVERRVPGALSEGALAAELDHLLAS